MAGWVQNRDANWRVPYTGGWCLKYVEDAFGTAHNYPDAITSWNSNPGNGNHPNELPPAGITVPVYFSLGNVPQGHVAIRLDDLTVASSTHSGTHPQGYLHPNIQDLETIYGQYNGGCTYLGWSENLAGTQLVTYVNDLATDDQIRQAYLDILERPADDAGLAHYRAFTNDFVRNDLLASGERATLVANKQAVADTEAKLAAEKAAADAALAAQPPVVVPEPQPTHPDGTPLPAPVEPPIVEPTPTPPVESAPVSTPWAVTLVALIGTLIAGVITWLHL